MRFICFTQFYPPSIGGMQFSNKFIIEGLVKSGHEVEIHVFGQKKNQSSFSGNIRREDYEVLPLSIINHFKCAYIINKKVRNFHPDFVLLLDESMPRSLGFLPKVRKQGYKYISINSGSVLTRGASHFRGKVNAWFVSRGYKWLDMLFVGQSTANNLSLMDQSLLPEVCSLGRPIPEIFYNINDQKISCESIFENDLPIFFSCSRAESGKGIGLVIRSLAKIRNENGKEKVNFLFAGDGKDLKKYVKLSQDLRLKNVHFLGRVANEDLPKYFCSSYMSILPSNGIMETFGRVWVESFACGIPVISTDNDNLKYLVKDGENAILIKSNIESITEGIYRALNLKSTEYRMMVDKSKKTAEQYRQSAIVEKLLNSLSIFVQAEK